MALYLIETNAGTMLVRAVNGHRATELTGLAGNVMRVMEYGDEGVIGQSVSVPTVDAPEDEQDDEIEVTDLSDKGVRRFRNKKTGRTRTATK